MEEVSTGDKSVVISSHNLTELEKVCDDILILNEGRVEYHNTLDNIKRNIKKDRRNT